MAATANHRLCEEFRQSQDLDKRQFQFGCLGERKGTVEDRVLGSQERKPSQILWGRVQGHLLERPSASVLHRPSNRQQLDAAPRMGCMQGLG